MGFWDDAVQTAQAATGSATDNDAAKKRAQMFAQVANSRPTMPAAPIGAVAASQTPLAPEVDTPDQAQQRMPPAVLPNMYSEARPSEPKPPTMPPATLPDSMRSPAFSGDSSSLPSRQIDPAAESKMPPAIFSGANAQPQTPGTAENKMPPAGGLDDLLKNQPQRETVQPPGFWKKALATAAAGLSGFATKNPEIGTDIGNKILNGPQEAADKRYDQKTADWDRAVKVAQEILGIQQKQQEFPTDQRLKSAQAAEAEARTKQLQQPENPQDKKVDEYVNDKGQRVLTFQKANGETYDRVGGKTQQKDSRNTSPFEAFAYGTPDEKKAAQNFLDLEHSSARKYDKPSEIEERYRLYQHDPQAYTAMFGDKTGGGVDKNTATRMLNYFDKRRREIQGDFTLEDDQKKQQLQDIDNLSQPFMDAVQPGAGRGAGGDRVDVISPNGQRGTIPRSQLGAAQKKGYKTAN